MLIIMIDFIFSLALVTFNFLNLNFISIVINT